MKAKKYNPDHIKEQLHQGKSIKELAYFYNVTKSRMYQVLYELEIKTVEQVRKTQSDTWTSAEKWFWRIITMKHQKTSKAYRMAIMKNTVLPTHCPVLDIEIDYSGGKGIREDNSPSIDQLIPQRGYNPENIRVMSWRANRIKNDGTAKEHQAISDYLKRLEK
ncbi:hypothetical protein [uncultured Paraglaciecola sp.]|uniref:hypothetical protein n=1 Tax=uncultured Paraglaciecola sp. TaxID=1765024 RepID=UPI00261EEB29|nr:hypothetical protein [uncultured Paraglaciecola sp.]